jgi:glyoxylase-like metal-dependent hydrolase (beta-lactamase superfamily II)
VPRLLAALEALGIHRDAVDWVLPTHAHLDHAGGAGLLMQRLPRARLLAQARAAPHLIDPTRLQAGATEVYGAEEMARSYGEIVPVDAARVVSADDGTTITLGTSRVLEFVDTPGHARHHHCVWDARTRRWFTGDTFGLSYPEFVTHQGPWITATTTPVQFEPGPLKASIAKLLERDPDGMCLTHYGLVRNVHPLARELTDQIDEMAALARSHAEGDQRKQRLMAALAAMYRRRLAAHGVTDIDAMMPLLDLDIDLNADGLLVWVDRARRKAA